MDFLTAAFLYTVFALFTFGCFWLGGPLSKKILPVPVVDIIHDITQKFSVVVLFCIPAPVKQGGETVCHYLFFQRNRFWLAVYISGTLMCYVIAIMDGAAYLYMVEPEKSHVFLPLVCLFVNNAFLMLCCLTDAGEITAHTFKTYENVFRFDGVLYKKNASCKTCKIPKPARSKHCGIYNKCIYKFDHYCLWSANVVGGLNHRWFVGFLVSLCLMAAVSIWRLYQIVKAIILIFGLWKLKYVDDSGNHQAMDTVTIIQTLFMQFPRLVFLQAVTMMTFAMVLIYTVYHVYLMATNQTINERYKLAYHMSAGTKMSESSSYSKGLLQNIINELFPYRLLNKTKLI